MVYAIDSRESLQSTPMWLEEFLHQLGESKLDLSGESMPVMALVGNKMDLEEKR